MDHLRTICPGDDFIADQTDMETSAGKFPGNDIAGTGTITAAGRVGPIGGIQQKIVAAADAGAKVFLVPADNCESAQHADVKKGEIRLVKAATLHSAVTSLETYAKDPSADLPACG